jgi:HEAT repeat protein
LANRIVKQVVKWSIGENFNYQMRQTQGRQMFAPRQMAETAKITLLEMLHPLAVNALIEVMQTSFDEYTRIEVAELLEKIVPGQPTAIATLIEIMHNSEQGWQTKAVRSLGNIAQGNQEAIAALVNLLQTIRANPDEWATRVEVASSLSKIEPGHPEAIPVPEYSCLYSPMFQDLVRLGQIQPNNPGWITALVDQVRSNPTDEREEFNRRWAVQHLKASDTSSPEASAALIDLIRSNCDEETLREAVRSLGRIGKSDPEATNVLIDLSYNSQNWVISEIAIEGLSYTDTNPEKVINALIELICTSPDQKICSAAARSAAAHSLGQILQRYPSGSAVSTLKNTLPAQINNNNHFKLYFDLYRNCYDALLNCAQNMPYPDFYQAWHQTTIH